MTFIKGVRIIGRGSFQAVIASEAKQSIVQKSSAKRIVSTRRRRWMASLGSP
jgi:hypothetical protein